MKTIKKAIGAIAYISILGGISIVCVGLNGLESVKVFFKGKRKKGFPVGNPPLKEGRITTIEPVDPPLSMNIWYQQLRNKN